MVSLLIDIQKTGLNADDGNGIGRKFQNVLFIFSQRLDFNLYVKPSDISNLLSSKEETYKKLTYQDQEVNL